MPLGHPWSEHPDGWSAFASDLQLGTPDEVRTPKGDRIDLMDPKWAKERDAEGDLVSWTWRLPGGKTVVIFND